MKEYDSRAEGDLAKLSEKLALLAATDLSTYQKIEEMHQIVIKMDGQLARAFIDFENDKIDNQVFDSMNTKANELAQSLPLQFANIIRSVDDLAL